MNTQDLQKLVGEQSFTIYRKKQKIRELKQDVFNKVCYEAVMSSGVLTFSNGMIFQRASAFPSIFHWFYTADQPPQIISKDEVWHHIKAQTANRLNEWISVAFSNNLEFHRVAHINHLTGAWDDFIDVNLS